MRIIYVTSSLPHGKKEAFLVPEIVELMRRGHEILVVPTYPRGEVLHGDAKPLWQHVVSEPLLSAGITRKAIKRFRKTPARALNTLRCLLGSRSAGVLLRNLVVYPKGLWLADLAWDWRADHIHAHWSTVPATLALVAGEVSGLPWSVTTHRFDIAEDNLLAEKTRQACFVRAINRRGAREIVERAGGGASPHVIHMGVALPVAKAPTRQDVNGRVFRLVVPANLLEVKGHTYLIDAVRLLADRGIRVRLDVAGDGPLRATLAAQAEKLDLKDDVTFLGLLPHERLLEKLRTGEWDALVLPSIVSDAGEKEGIPVSIIEAMSCGVPVVSTLTGGIPELFEGVDDALLVPPRDPASLAAAIERLIGDPDLRKRLSESGRRRVEQGFAIEQVVSELVERFEGCAERQQPKRTTKTSTLILTQYFPPETGAGAKRIGPLADVLNERFDVTVFALKPSYPSPEEYRDVSLGLHDSALPYRIKRLFGFHPHKGSLLLRALREQVMAVRLALHALPESPDVIVTSSPSMFLGPAALVVARLKKARFVWDVRDITWGYARDFVGSSPLMALATRGLEKYVLWALRRADLIVGASRGITERLIEDGVAPGRAITVLNGISTELMDAIAHETTGEAHNQRPMVAYAGVIGYNQGLSVLLDAARRLPDVDFVLAGDGPELPQLKDRARELGIRNVDFTGFLNREKLLDLYNQSDILIAHAKSSPTIDATMVPVKLFEYMATGRPIVYAGKGIAVDLLRDVGCAVTVPPEEPEAIADAVLDLLRDPERMRELGLKGRDRVREDFHRDKLMQRLAQTLQERFASALGAE